ncbi:MAG: rod shape-determining protein MreC [Pseudomonadota bacterium]|nr:rod shape-determining protein MreC [Pseudomonadota bacterium]
MRRLFTTESSSKFVLFALSLISVCLLLVESRNETMLNPLREGIAIVTNPIQLIAETPYFLTDALIDFFSSRNELQEKNSILEDRIRELSYAMQRLDSVESENTRLRALLGSRERLSGDVLVAEIVGIDPDMQKREVVIDKGTIDGVRVRQAVIEAEGLFGQVVATTRSSARVLMVSDARHAIPVEVVRSGFRSIAVGTGLSDRLYLENVPTTADLRKGDMLVSSGLGGRFPRGYPVGEVQSIDVDPTRNDADVYTSVQARLDTSRHVLILFDDKQP